MNGSHPQNMAENPLRRALLRTYLKFAHSRPARRLWDLGRFPNPNGHADWMEVSAVNLTLPRLPAEFDRYRIVQISDLHVGTWLKPSNLEQAVQVVNAQEPDLVVITGDFVTYLPEHYAPAIIDALGQLAPRDGVLAVLGNHDHWSNPIVVREMIAGAGALDLSNRVYTLERGGKHLHLAGIDCSYLGLDRLDFLLDHLPPGEAAILLAHEPDFAVRSSASGRFDLQLSGHSHGGQVSLPRIGPIFLPRHGRQYPSGLYQIGGMILYTNRGLGTAEIQLRISCPPEIAVITLMAPRQSRMSDSY